MNPQTRQFHDRFRQWANSLPVGSATLVENTAPTEEDDDEYGCELILTLNPKNEKACPLEIMVVPSDSLSFSIDLNTWGGVSKYLGIDIPNRLAILSAMFIEPHQLSVNTVIELCNAVAKGKINLTIGVLFGRFSILKGEVILPAGKFPMSTVGGNVWLYRMLSFIHCAEIKTVKYDPWY